ncbi:MAG: transposase [Ferruginibacter sp.]
MKFVPSHIYHVYNQGNNRQVIFTSAKEYLYFLQKAGVLIRPDCEVLAYCLMPNHFHFLLRATILSVEEKRLGNITTNRLSNAFRLLLSEYAQDFNIWHNRTGSLFRQKTKAIDLSETGEADAALNCYNYIHNNPSAAGLVSMSKDWEFSSLKDYLGIRQNRFCNQQLAFQLLGIDENYVKEMALHL